LREGVHQWIARRHPPRPSLKGRVIAYGELAPGSQPPTPALPARGREFGLRVWQYLTWHSMRLLPLDGGGWEGVCSTLKPKCDSPPSSERERRSRINQNVKRSELAQIVYSWDGRCPNEKGPGLLRGLFDVGLSLS